jgi:hypothetical protein
VKTSLLSSADFASLLVIARNSSYQFRGKAIDVKEVGQKLGVHFVVEGSVRKIGNTGAGERCRFNRYGLCGRIFGPSGTIRDLVNIFEIQERKSLAR